MIFSKAALARSLKNALGVQFKHNSHNNDHLRTIFCFPSLQICIQFYFNYQFHQFSPSPSIKRTKERSQRGKSIDIVQFDKVATSTAKSFAYMYCLYVCNISVPI